MLKSEELARDELVVFRSYLDFLSGWVAEESRQSAQYVARILEPLLGEDPAAVVAHCAIAEPAPRPPRSSAPDRAAAGTEEVEVSPQIDPEATRPMVAQRRTATEAALEATFISWERGVGDLETVPALLAKLKYLDNAWALVS